MSSCWQQADWSIMADTSKNCHRFSTELKFYDLEDYNLVTKVLLNLDRFYSRPILATMQYFFTFRNPTIMDQFVTFGKRV